MTRPLTVVTGGTRGIGAATALRLAADGHDLVLGFAGDVATAEKTAARVREAGADCRVVQVDVAEADQVDALFDAAAEQGRVTGLVNNAGVTLHSAPLAETPVDVVRRVVEVNLTGAILVARRAAQLLGEGGSIVNVSSAAATLGSPGEYVHYAAAKAGVEALTKGLSLELAPRGIRVNAVAPGIIRTDIHAAAGDPDRVERVAPSVPLGRAGEPEEVAEAIAWLMSEASSYTTGSVLRVTGGR